MARGRSVTFAAIVYLAPQALVACTTTANVSEVWMSIDEDGARRRSVFYTDSESVTCVAKVGVGRNDATFELLVRRVAEAPPGTDDYQPVNKVVVAREVHPDVTADAPAIIALSMKPTSVGSDGKLKEDEDAPFTPGSYVCEVSVDGVTQKHAAFNIEYAPCPTVQIQQTAPCLGFYQAGTQCPAAGATGDPTPTCACTDRGWQCDRK
jgi:hypothetical protein